MNPDAYGYVLGASLAGGLVGALVMWNRKRSQIAGKSRLRGFTVLTLGTAASGGALVAFTQAFSYPPIYAAMVILLVTGWAAVVQSVVRLPLPPNALSVGAGEFALLSRRWTGVRSFGTCLRSTPLRHLGGRVFLAEAGQNIPVVLRGLQEAELVHIWAILFSCPWLVVWTIHAQWTALVCSVATHLPLNVYPILHLRYVTFRIERFATRAQRSPTPLRLDPQSGS